MLFPDAAGIRQHSPNGPVKLDKLHEQAVHSEPPAFPDVSPDFVTSLQFETSMEIQYYRRATTIVGSCSTAAAAAAATNCAYAAPSLPDFRYKA